MSDIMAVCKMLDEESDDRIRCDNYLQKQMDELFGRVRYLEGEIHRITGQKVRDHVTIT